jgi:hypothetical protein
MKINTAILLKMIHKKCLECSCGSRLEVDNCILKDCPLYHYRNIKEDTTNDEE